MPLELQPLKKEDALEAAQLVIASFANNPFRKILFPTGYAESTKEKMVQTRYKAVDDPDKHALKVVDTDNGGKIVACAIWMYTKSMTDDDWDREREEALASYPEARKDILDEFIYKEQDSKRRIKGSRRWWELDSLNTLPEYSRRGIGSRLVKWGTDLLEEKKMPGFIVSTDQGYGLYIKHGFKEVERWEVDLGRWTPGGKRVMYKNAFLVRKPVADAVS